jgi:hypothetical protein
MRTALLGKRGRMDAAYEMNTAAPDITQGRARGLVASAQVRGLRTCHECLQFIDQIVIESRTGATLHSLLIVNGKAPKEIVLRCLCQCGFVLSCKIGHGGASRAPTPGPTRTENIKSQSGFWFYLILHKTFG